MGHTSQSHLTVTKPTPRCPPSYLKAPRLALGTNFYNEYSAVEQITGPDRAVWPLEGSSILNGGTEWSLSEGINFKEEQRVLIYVF